jgi:hypothetical protein
LLESDDFKENFVGIDSDNTKKMDEVQRILGASSAKMTTTTREDGVQENTYTFTMEDGSTKVFT